MSAATPLKFYASMFSSLDQYRCPLQLRNSMTPCAAPEATGKPAKDAEPAVSDCRRGIDFESNLFEALASTNGPIPVIGDTSERKTLRRISVVKVADWNSFKSLVERLLSTSSQGQPEDVIVRDLDLTPAEVASMSAEVFHPVSQIVLGHAKPDVVRLSLSTGVDGHRYVTVAVADIKSAPHVKRYHRLQIAMYHRLLDGLIQQWVRGTEGKAFAASSIKMSDQGEVWLDASRGRRRPATVTGGECDFVHGNVALRIEPFDVTASVAQITDFSRQVLPLVTVPDIEAVPWVLRDSCRSCDYLEACQKKAMRLAAPPSGENLSRQPDEEEDTEAEALLDDDNILSGVPTTAPTLRATQGQSGDVSLACLIAPRTIPIFSPDALRVCTGGYVTSGGECAFYCGRPKKDGNPCRMQVASEGAGCRFHGGANDGGDDGKFYCGRPTKKEGNPPCRIEVDAPGAACRYHGDLKPAVGGTGGGSLLDGRHVFCIAIASGGGVPSSVDSGTPSSEFFFAGYDCAAAKTFTSARPDAALEWLDGQIGRSNAAAAARPLFLVYDQRQAKQLHLFLATHPQLAMYVANFDQLIRMRAELLQGKPCLQNLVQMLAVPSIVSIVETSKAHFLFSPSAFLPDVSLLTARCLCSALLGGSHPSSGVRSADFYDPRRTPRDDVARALPWLSDVVAVIEATAAANATVRRLPVDRPALSAAIPIDDSGAALDGSRLMAHETAAAAVECLSTWLHRCARGKTPMVCKTVQSNDPDNGKTMRVEVFFPADAAQDSEVRLWFNALHATAGISQESYLDALQDTLDVSSDFKNGSWLCIPCDENGNISASSLRGAVAKVDTFRDWQHYTSFRIRDGCDYRDAGDIVGVERLNSCQLQVTVELVRKRHNALSSHVLLVPDATNYNFGTLNDRLVAARFDGNVLWSLCARGDTAGVLPPPTPMPLATMASGLQTPTRAQQDFVSAVQNETLTVLWGPPGTGKTTTLAWMLSRMCGPGSAFLGRKVLVIANTNSALEQLYVKLVGMFPQEVSGGFLGGLNPTFKWSNEAAPRVKPSLGRMSSQNVCSVLFSTVWKLHKHDDALPEAFDALIVDEASQMLVSNAMIAAPYLRRSAQTRIIVAGDTLQLPPIPPQAIAESRWIPARYGTDAVVFQSSILESMMFHGTERSNGSRLSRVVASDLMSPAFQGTTPGSTRIVMLDISYRSVPTIVQGVTQLYQQKLKCSEQNAKLPLCPKDVTYYCVGSSPCTLVAEAEHIWTVVKLQWSRGGQALPSKFTIGIVTPHRRQRRAATAAIKNHVADMPPATAVFVNQEQIAGPRSGGAGPSLVIDVDTSECMQGREYDVVILALGSVRPTAFVLNLRRINVATSRAQRKLISVVNGSIHNVTEADIAALEGLSAASSPVDGLGPRQAWIHLKRFLATPFYDEACHQDKHSPGASSSIPTTVELHRNVTVAPQAQPQRNYAPAAVPHQQQPFLPAPQQQQQQQHLPPQTPPALLGASTSRMLCGAPTAKGTPCKNPVKAAADRCHLHKDK